MKIQRRMMLLNPLAAWAYGAWFIIQPDGYLRMVGNAPGPVTPQMMSVFISFGAVLLAMGYLQMLLRAQTTPQTLPQNMTAFGAVWVISAAGIFFSIIAYAEDIRGEFLEIIEIGIFVLIGAGFVLMRNPSLQDTAPSAPAPQGAARKV